MRRFKNLLSCFLPHPVKLQNPLPASVTNQYSGRFQNQLSNVVLVHYWQDEQCLPAKAIALDIASPATDFIGSFAR